mgnify:FL=1
MVEYEDKTLFARLIESDSIILDAERLENCVSFLTDTRVFITGIAECDPDGEVIDVCRQADIEIIASNVNVDEFWQRHDGALVGDLSAIEKWEEETARFHLPMKDIMEMAYIGAHLVKEGIVKPICIPEGVEEEDLEEGKRDYQIQIPIAFEKTWDVLNQEEKEQMVDSSFDALLLPSSAKLEPGEA